MAIISVLSPYYWIFISHCGSTTDCHLSKILHFKKNICLLTFYVLTQDAVPNRLSGLVAPDSFAPFHLAEVILKSEIQLTIWHME